MLSGSMSMLLLKLLSEKDMYGYEMIEVLRSRSENVFDLKTGTLYTLLHSLAKNKYLKAYDKEVNGKTRKYYGITPLGEAFVKENDEKIQSIFYGAFTLTPCFVPPRSL